MQFLSDFAAGTITGVITGFGVGGGTLLILYLTMFRGFSQLPAQGINLVYFLPTAISALISHIRNKNIVWSAVIFTAAAGLVTTIAAAIVASKLDTTLLRRIFGGFLLLVGISELTASGKNRE